MFLKPAIFLLILTAAVVQKKNKMYVHVNIIPSISTNCACSTFYTGFNRFDWSRLGFGLHTNLPINKLA